MHVVGCWASACLSVLQSGIVHHSAWCWFYTYVERCTFLVLYFDMSYGIESVRLSYHWYDSTKVP